MKMSKKEEKRLKQEIQLEQAKYGIPVKKKNKGIKIILIVIASLFALFCLSLCTGGDNNSIGEEIQVTENAYMCIPQKWKECKQNFDSGSHFSNFESTDPNTDFFDIMIFENNMGEYYNTFNTTSLDEYAQLYLDNEKNNTDFKIINKEYITINEVKGRMIEYTYDMGGVNKGKTMHCRLYVFSNEEIVDYIIYSQPISDDFTLIENVIQSFHY
ncbi:hypothetical protein ACTQYZ_06075 [Anaerofustis sp. LCP19S3_F7]|uniref:hypothetical protein n=1 Tax=Anaerofustis sp. LCP19S3_F7 TaxID=3440247 RepID=UPI003F91C7D0